MSPSSKNPRPAPPHASRIQRHRRRPRHLSRILRNQTGDECPLPRKTPDPLLRTLHASSATDDARDIYRESFKTKPVMNVPFLEKPPTRSSARFTHPAPPTTPATSIANPSKPNR